MRQYRIASSGRHVGNYTLGALIGSGAVSEVYAGTHRFLGDPVAIKLVRDVAAAEALVAEAAHTRAVEHDNVVRVLDVGRDEASGGCYLVMERVDGENLAARLRRLGRLDEAEARRLGAAIADGMQAAHDRGLVHRDLKPANVMLRGDDPKIVDFGIAKPLGDRSAVQTARRVGTPAYMAPEQLVGGLIAPGVDIWALGVILFEMAAGRRPFDGYDDGRCPQLFEAAPRLSSVSPEFEALVARCLAREPGQRPASMALVARALRGEHDTEVERLTADLGPVPAASAPSETATPSAPATPSATQLVRGRSWPLIAAVAAGVIALGLLAAVMLRGHDAGARAAASPDAGAGSAAATAADAAPAAAADAAAGVAEPAPKPTHHKRKPRDKPHRETLD